MWVLFTLADNGLRRLINLDQVTSVEETGETGEVFLVAPSYTLRVYGSVEQIMLTINAVDLSVHPSTSLEQMIKDGPE